MFPGMDPRMVKQAMKKMGMKQEEIQASEVIIKAGEKNLIFHNPQVARISMMGEESFQITGTWEEVSAITEEDLETVMAQSTCTKDQAKKALENAKGDLAKAILALQE